MEEEKSLKECLLQDADDLEGILQLLGRIFTQGRNSDDPNIDSLVILLANKQQAMEEKLKKAGAYSERESVIEKLEEQVRIREEYLTKLYTSLKDSETLLISAIFQANQKLKSIGQANQQKVVPEELIKYAHLISKTNAVAAPLSWQQGDPERPFPTDVEMRKGHLQHLMKRIEPTPMEGMGSMFPPSGPPMGAGQGLVGVRYSSPQRQASPGAANPYQQAPGLQRSYSGGPPGGFPQRMGSPAFPYQPQAGGPATTSPVMQRAPPPYPGAMAQRNWPQSPGLRPGFSQPSPQQQMAQSGISPRMRVPTPNTGLPQRVPLSTGPMSSPRMFGTPASAMPPQVINPYLGGVNQMRQRRPQAPSQRISTPPVSQASRPTAPKPKPAEPNVETVSSDSSSSSSSENSPS